MKIFNWVHRKLNGQPSSLPLHPCIAGEVKMSQLNTQVKSHDDEDIEALFGWRDGLLAIGTLGLHTHHRDYIMIPNLNVFDYPKDSVTNVENLDEPKLMEEIPIIGDEDDEVPLVNFSVYSSHEIEEEVDEKKKISLFIKTNDSPDVKVNNEKGTDRTTLADLFKADTTVARQRCVGKSVSVLKENNEKDIDGETGRHAKLIPSSLSGNLVKKLISSHDVQPIKKINHMMRKMMKRKIHPELLREKSASGIILENKNQAMINEVQGYN